MNPNFHAIIQAADDERRGPFLTAAARLGTAVQNVEKDFWVCWTLDALFNGLSALALPAIDEVLQVIADLEQRLNTSLT